jgi:acetoin utilization protein AcuC
MQPTEPRRARLVTHPIFREPAFGRNHPLSTRRQPATLELIEALGWADPACIAVPALPDRATLERLHAAHYLDAFEAAVAAGRASIEDRAHYNLGSMECPIFPGLWTRAIATVGGALLAADLAHAGCVAFHPGGGTHHGRADRASGFCYLNDPAFAILRLLEHGLTRVFYLDLDAHHGDGVEALWGMDDRVRLLSLHEAGRWPGTGALDDTCDGRALNVPLPRETNDAEHAALLEASLWPLLARWQPEALVVTLGADGLAGDPLSSMQLTNSHLWRTLLRCLAAVPRAVILGGGGYNPWTTARLWAGTWGLLHGAELPGQLPPAARAVLEGLDCDLVDDEDRDPAWLTRLADPPTPNALATEPVRAEVPALVEAVERAFARLRLGSP